MKYAIVESGGKQYKAVEGGKIEVDLLPERTRQEIDLNSVLLLVDGDKDQGGYPNRCRRECRRKSRRTYQG